MMAWSLEIEVKDDVHQLWPHFGNEMDHSRNEAGMKLSYGRNVQLLKAWRLLVCV